ncbi:PTS trehalose transporter subunit IIBC [Tetragenococcus halophilus]|uniref:PTS system sucrose-specific EIIBCA component n=1 Tax=Tetragenococcus halophilus TaxID=51669 RepID=A0A3G5FGB0_TETHA|nr:PTS system trehalose-specific EIIBC component [Tetragenococcus halophilus]AYW49349.1 PTS trehalose transporter subunit IIBC [Tetragenococcus halophilus]GBD62639.1 trehalose-specific phosphotransferase system enzyme IIBC component [Tetragenococcus halophilus subsp. flandriensis]
MGKYEEDAKRLLKEVGGKENINAVTHCATRMRFVLNDPDKADQEAIDDIPSVKGMFTNAGQFQVIIGNDVATFYNDFKEASGIEGTSTEDAKSVAKKNQNPLQRAVGALAEIFAPIIPAIIVGGLILGFRNILEGVDFGGATIVACSTFWAAINDFLWLPGEAIFQFLPVGITWSVTRKMGTTQILGIVLGITLVSPQLLDANEVASTAAADIPKWDLGFTQIDMIGYQGQVIPAMLAGFLLAYLEIFFRKHIPEAVSMIFVPLFALLPTIIAAHVVLGPFGWWLGNIISNVIFAGLTSSISWLFSFAFGLLYSPLVITGLHHMSNAIDLQLVASEVTNHTTSLWPMIALSNIAQGSAVLAIIYLHRGDKKEEQVSIPAMISCYLGVTEPAMFGVNLKYIYPFVAAMIGSGFAGLFNNFMDVRANSIGVGGLPGILVINSQIGGGYLAFAISMVIAIVVSFILTVVFRKRGIFNKEDREDSTPDLATAGATAGEAGLSSSEEGASASLTDTQKATEKLFAPVSGELLKITAVDDPVFSQKMMGDGYAVKPTEDQIYAPVTGTISSVFETKHAIGILTDGGVEVLVHMGLDTVELKGAPFTINVKENDRVSADTQLATMDRKAVEDAGKQTDVLTVFTNGDKINSFAIIGEGEVAAQEDVGEIEVSE